MIAVFFGGRSCEHDISIITGLQAMSACTSRCIGVYIDRDGVWWAAEPKDLHGVTMVREKKFKGTRVHLRPGDNCLYSKNKKLYKIDAALLCNHGALGEDGALAGLLKMYGIPFTGSDVEASAIGMDKLRTKAVFERAGLNVLPYLPITRTEYNTDVSIFLSRAEKTLGYPVIVKPCNLGSSIGISVAKNANELFTSLRVAFEWDDTVIVEKAITDFIEVNCAVIDDGEGNTTVSQTEQPVGWKEFLTFDDKYSGDKKHSKHKIPADVGDETNGKIQELALTAFRAVGCSGVARVDFLVKDENIYVNEINTIPGSLAYMLFKDKMSFSRLIDILIKGALARQKSFDRLRRTYTPVTPVTGK